MRLLVTGGAGFIGANFVRTTVRERPDVRVTVLDSLTYAGSRESLAEVDADIRLVRGDITDAGLVGALVTESDAVGVAGAWTLDNFQTLLTRPLYYRAIIRSFVVGTAVGALVIVLSYPLAYFLVRTTSRWRNLLIEASAGSGAGWSPRCCSRSGPGTCTR